MKPDISKGHRILIPSHTVAYIHNFTLFQLDSALSDYLSPIWLARLLEPDSDSRPQCRFNPSRTASNSKNSGLQTSSKSRLKPGFWDGQIPFVRGTPALGSQEFQLESTERAQKTETVGYCPGKDGAPLVIL